MRAAFFGLEDLAGAFFTGADFFPDDFPAATFVAIFPRPDGLEADFFTAFLAAPFAAADLPAVALPPALPADFAAADLPGDPLPADLPTDDFALAGF